MSDNEEQSGSAETTQGTSHSVGELNAKAGEQLKKQRTQLRGKVTRSINRVKKFIDQGAEMRKRYLKNRFLNNRVLLITVMLPRVVVTWN